MFIKSCYHNLCRFMTPTLTTTKMSPINHDTMIQHSRSISPASSLVSKQRMPAEYGCRYPGTMPRKDPTDLHYEVSPSWRLAHVVWMQRTMPFRDVLTRGLWVMDDRPNGCDSSQGNRERGYHNGFFPSFLSFPFFFGIWFLLGPSCGFFLVAPLSYDCFYNSFYIIFIIKLIYPFQKK